MTLFRTRSRRNGIMQAKGSSLLRSRGARTRRPSAPDVHGSFAIMRAGFGAITRSWSQVMRPDSSGAMKRVGGGRREKRSRRWYGSPWCDHDYRLLELVPFAATSTTAGDVVSHTEHVISLMEGRMEGALPRLLSQKEGSMPREASRRSFPTKQRDRRRSSGSAACEAVLPRHFLPQQAFR